MNANHTAIRVMKQAAATPDRSDLSGQGGKGTEWQVAGGRVGTFSAPPPERKALWGEGYLL